MYSIMVANIIFMPKASVLTRYSYQRGSENCFLFLMYFMSIIFRILFFNWLNCRETTFVLICYYYCIRELCRRAACIEHHPTTAICTSLVLLLNCDLFIYLINAPFVECLPLQLARHKHHISCDFAFKYSSYRK